MNSAPNGRELIFRYLKESFNQTESMLLFPTNAYNGSFTKEVHASLLKQLQNSSNPVYYFVTYKSFFHILNGYYGSLQNITFNSKTQARRFIQEMIRNVNMDNTIVVMLKNSLLRSGYYQENATAQQENAILTTVLNKITLRNNELQNALLHPNVSYRAYPMFRR